MVTHGSQDSIELMEAVNTMPSTPNTNTNPAVMVAADDQGPQQVGPGVVVGALEPEEERQVGRQHGEPARVHRRHHAHPEGVGERGVDHGAPSWSMADRELGAVSTAPMWT